MADGVLTIVFDLCFVAMLIFTNNLLCFPVIITLMVLLICMVMLGSSLFKLWLYDRDSIWMRRFAVAETAEATN